MSVSLVSVLWSLLSLVVAVSFWLCLLQPHWLVHSDTMTSLGVLSYCYHADDDDDQVAMTTPGGGRAAAVAVGLSQRCEVYGGPSFHFSKLPSEFWQASCVLLGSASVVMSTTVLTTTLTLCLHRPRDCTLAAVTGYVQIIAVLLFTGGLLVFPVGLGSSVVRQVCGSSSTSYWPGDCSVGWTSVLALVTDALALFCPFLSRHIHTKLRHTSTLVS